MFILRTSVMSLFDVTMWILHVLSVHIGSKCLEYCIVFRAWMMHPARMGVCKVTSRGCSGL